MLVFRPISLRTSLATSLTLGLMLVAVLLRLPGHANRALWIDELWRVNLVLDPNLFERYVHQPSVYTAITAPLYAVIANLIAYFDMAPDTLRLLSFIPGILVTGLTVTMILKSEGSYILAMLVGLLFAVNVDFIGYSNGFKPYMFEVLVHACCFYCWFDLVRKSRTTRFDWLRMFVVLILAPLCAANIIIIIPAIFLTLIVKARQDKVVLFRYLLMGVGLLTVLIGTLYWFVWSYGSDKDLINYWSEGFYKLNEESSYLEFITRKISEIWISAFTSFADSRDLSMVITILFFLSIILNILSVKNYSSRSESRIIFYIFSFFFLLISTVLVLNFLNKWPLGAYRPNLFLYAYCILFFCLSVSLVSKAKKLNFLLVVPILLIIQQLYAVNSAWLSQFSVPIESSDLVWSDFGSNTQNGVVIQQTCPEGRSLVFINPGMGNAIDYYRKRAAAKEIESSLIDSKCVDIKPITDAHPEISLLDHQIDTIKPITSPFWVLHSHLTMEEASLLISVFKKLGDVEINVEYPGAGYFKIVPK